MCRVPGAITDGSKVCVLVAAVVILLSMLGKLFKQSVPSQLQGVWHDQQRQRGVHAGGILLSMLGLNLSGPESKIPHRLQGVGRNHQRQRGVRPGGGGGDSSLHAGPQPERAAHPGRRCAGVGGERSQPQLPGRLLPLRRPGKDFHILMF